MGDVADMMLDGTLCAGCGVFDENMEPGAGFPQLCDDCLADPETVRAWGREPETWVNGLVCPTCKSFIFSRARHDFRSCVCGNILVDGGFDYMRAGSKGAVPVSERRQVKATRKQLYDDWNKHTDLYGLVPPPTPVEVLATAGKESTDD